MAHIHDKNGEVLSEETEVIGRWKEHFEGLFQETDAPYQIMPGRGVAVVDDLHGDNEGGGEKRCEEAEDRKGTRNVWDCARDVKSRG